MFFDVGCFVHWGFWTLASFGGWVFFEVGDFVRWSFWTLTVLNVEKFLTLRVFDLEALDVGNFVR